MYKALEEIHQPDFRQTLWSGWDLETWHRWVGGIVLCEAVPKEIREHFDTAKNVLLYSWYDYDMQMAGLLFASTVFEEALRAKLGHGREYKDGLKSLMDEAIVKGLLDDRVFPNCRAETEVRGRQEDGGYSVERVQKFGKLIRDLRNSLAHGERKLFEVHRLVFDLARMINSLFSVAVIAEKE